MAKKKNPKKVKPTPEQRLRMVSARLREAEELLADLVDPDRCSYDHNGHCQAHCYFGDPPCVQARAKEFLGGVDATYRRSVGHG